MLDRMLMFVLGLVPSGMSAFVIKETGGPSWASCMMFFIVMFLWDIKTNGTLKKLT